MALDALTAIVEADDAQCLEQSHIEQARAAIAALQAEPQPAPVHPNHRADLRYVRKVLDDVRSLALTEGDKLCGDVDAAINGMDYIIKRTEEAAALPATPPKD
jgi:hypothetical protein